MNRNRWIMVAAGVALVLVLGAFAFDQSQNDKIAKGVTIGGIDVSGLSRADAKAKLSKEIEAVVQQPIVVTSNGKRRTLKPEKSKVGVDVPGMVNEAVEQSNSGFFITDAARSVAGSSRNIVIPVEITYSKPAVRRFVRSVHKSFDQQAKDASIKYSATSIGEVDSQNGEAVEGKKLTRAIVTRLENPTEPRTIKAPMRTTDAKVTTRAELAKKYPTIILVDRSGFKLRLYKKLKLAKTYPIAVGQAGLETPAGLYTINDRQVNPAWHVPNSDWAGDLAGTVVPPGPGNPIVARWLGIYDGVGIHGTDDIGSLGSAASHGCIRMKPSDVIALYPLVPLGTPVYIA
ncbi:MAG: L,D-transpeptidase family protein [Solirubrobacterales bacterium]